MIKVASYCRVSTDRDDQANSFESQQRYFKEYIDRKPDWELYDIYADEGISGTSTKKRAQFNRMIDDARMGKFSIIITKEVSRFSRNIIDTISFTRELKAMGVGVVFMNDGINTLDPDAELRLSIMGSIAQEESRRTSSRVKWGQTRQMEKGVVFGLSMLGYDVKDGQMTINPEGAEIVKLIFQKYGIEKKGTSTIARELREGGYKNSRGNVRWTNSTILKILKNEKYVGDLLQKKHYTPDYLTHEKKPNHGEEEMVFIKDHHEPIIERELWDIVQHEIQKRYLRHGKNVGHSNRYIFSGKIKCGCCGGVFVSKHRPLADGTRSQRWGCLSVYNKQVIKTADDGSPIYCTIGKIIRNDEAMDILKKTIRSLCFDSDWLVRNVTSLALDAIQSDGDENGDTADAIQKKIDQLIKKKEAILDAFFSGTIEKDELQLMKERYDKELANLEVRLHDVQERDKLRQDASSLASDIQREIKAILHGDTDSEAFYKNILDHMTVYPDGRVEVHLNLLPQKWIFELQRLRGRQGDVAFFPECI